uniref:Nuclear respiratory factor 1 NLS/DNA-binding dimerisation domain-containing protein n=1 Tax=Clastoptera arizonana TaxID=38151 RepID=A0A1B6CI65_9HEMI
MEENGRCPSHTIPKLIMKNKRLTTGLPLIMVKGKPKSIKKMNKMELFKFTKFMMECCKRNGIRKDFHTSGAPKWWPEKLLCIFPLQRTNTQLLIIDDLINIIESCYKYHNCKFLIEFSEKLSFLPDLRYKLDDENVCLYTQNNYFLGTFKLSNFVYDGKNNKKAELFSKKHPKPKYTKKRKSNECLICKTNIDSCEHEKSKRVKLYDLPEIEENNYLNKDLFLNMFGIKDINKEANHSNGRLIVSKKELLKKIRVLPFSSKKFQQILSSSGLAFDPEKEKRLSERNALALVARRSGSDDNISEYFGKRTTFQEKNSSWIHIYKWPKRSHCPRQLDRGSSLRPCFVVMKKLSKEEIVYHSFKTFEVSLEKENTLEPTTTLGACICKNTKLNSAKLNNIQIECCDKHLNKLPELKRVLYPNKQFLCLNTASKYIQLNALSFSNFKENNGNNKNKCSEMSRSSLTSSSSLRPCYVVMKKLSEEEIMYHSCKTSEVSLKNINTLERTTTFGACICKNTKLNSAELNNIQTECFDINPKKSPELKHVLYPNKLFLHLNIANKYIQQNAQEVEINFLNLDESNSNKENKFSSKLLNNLHLEPSNKRIVFECNYLVKINK